MLNKLPLLSTLVRHPHERVPTYSIYPVLAKSNTVKCILVVSLGKLLLSCTRHLHTGVPTHKTNRVPWGIP